MTTYLKLKYNMNEVNEIIRFMSDKETFVKINTDVFSGLGIFPEKN